MAKMQTKTSRPITIAIAAMGGQGGGVLSNWIVALAENAGYIAQTTSVPGVAQRTGATVYYQELFPRADAEKAGQEPVMALMPAPGDVDVVIAGELVEAGRSLMRGIITPDRTTLITSSHRDYALVEKMHLGDGRADSEKMLEAVSAAARKFISFDMAAVAEDSDSVISSVMFGALCGSGALPFEREQFEETIRSSGVAVNANLAGFAAGNKAAVGGEESAGDAVVHEQPSHPQVMALLTRVAGFPEAARENITEGVRRLIDYQDLAYAGEYLNRLDRILKVDEMHGDADKAHRLVSETARYLALWMSYEDTIRVAELKTRSTRTARYRKELRVGPDQLVYVSEFMHPRVEEICDTLPAWLGGLIMRTAWLYGFLGLFCRSGRRIRSNKLSGFLLLYIVSGFKRWRRGTLRYKVEDARLSAWLDSIAAYAAQDYDLGVEIAECQRLVKGYGETHQRGMHNFERIMDAMERIKRGSNPVQTVRELRAAALADEFGEILDHALQKVA